MANSENIPEHTENVRIAKIGAIQAVVVAIIAGAAGVAGTAGLRYVEHTNELARKDAQLQELKAKHAQEFDDLNEKLRRSTAVSAMLRGTTELSQEQCYERMKQATESAIPKAHDLGSSLTEPSNVGSRAFRGGYAIRVLCDSTSKLSIVTVAGTGSASEANRIATEILAALK